jgi:pyridoxal phosphate enzyme (YggS family)
MTTALGDIVATNLRAIRKRIAAACASAGRDPAEVTLVAVSKTFPPEAIVEAVRDGVTDIGENRVQEAAAKAPAVSAAGVRPRWHLVGHLQSNKARAALELFDVIESVDSVELGERIGRLAQRPIDVLLEVNVAGETSKFGLMPEDTPAAVRDLAAVPNLNVRGLMTVAPLVDDAEKVRPVFRQLRALRDELGLAELSMGMSGDFEVAIEEGATIVRVGRAIFGERTVPA